MSTCALQLGGLPNGLVEHVQTLFLKKINHKYLMFPPHEKRRMYLFRMPRTNRWKNNGNLSIFMSKGSWSSCQTADWRKINGKQHFSSIQSSSVAQTPLYSGYFGSFLGVKCPEREATPLLPYMTSCCTQQNRLHHSSPVVL
jgi:hypothetical protein